jgi:hypothetical protein
MAKIIMFAGPKHSGKDTAFELTRQFLPKAVKFAFADKLKDVCSAVFRVPRSNLDSTQGKEDLYCWPEILQLEQMNQVLTVYKRLGLSCKLEDTMRSTHNLNGRLIYSNRELLQVIGTDLLRTIDQSIHTTVYSRNLPKAEVIGTTDCRFMNELETGLVLDAITIYVERTEAERVAFESSHVSETESLELRHRCKYLLQNRGTINELGIFIKEILKAEGLYHGS